MVKDPIFSLVFATAGQFHSFSPAPNIRSDRSSRVINNDLQILDPISEVSFDTFALPAKEGTVVLQQVTQIDWIASLGRPLCVNYTYSHWGSLLTLSRFGAYHKALDNEAALLSFAKQKLSDGWFTLDAANLAGSLACLCVRFGLEFNADENSRRVACTQVERHMRLCLVATTGFETLITIAGSEPLLAEAASQIMGGSLARPVHHTTSPITQIYIASIVDNVES
jgi:hypothetical protein